MSGSLLGYSREAVRVKVKKCEGSMPPEFRKFSVDPQLTSFEVLQSILAKAFDLKGDFTICYKLYDSAGLETYMPLLSDYDLDAAFLKTYNTSLAYNAEPCLCLKVDQKAFAECPSDWELKQNPTFVMQIRTANYETKPAPRLHGIFNQVGKTLNLVQKALNFGEDGSAVVQPPRPPLSDTEFRRFLDPVGQIIYARELRSVIYFGGVEPSLRRVVWKHLLNVYPEGMTGKERMDYIKKKASEYLTLRETWKSAVTKGSMAGELAYTTGMVRKDVLRTDRHHPFYAGSDDNKNIACLFNILTTYALNHPKVSYCQGMSDLASPLLVTMDDEAHAYICFCALMKRLCGNFMIDGLAMTQKFTHLAEGLTYYDPEFYGYLKIHQADDLLFCYRWLLLEMKREFAFDDSLRMLEVLWSSLPADPPSKELELFDVPFEAPALSTPPVSPLLKTPRENPYTKVCALRRQSSSISLSNASCKNIVAVKRQNHSLDESLSRNKNLILDIKVKHKSFDDVLLKKESLRGHNGTHSKMSDRLQHSLNGEQGVNKKQQLSPISPPCFHQDVRSRSVSPLEQKSDSVLVHNRINTQKIPAKPKGSNLSSSMTNLIKKSKKATHFRDFKGHIVGGNWFSSLDHLDMTLSIKECSKNNIKGKVVKNFNEFLSFSSPVSSRSTSKQTDVEGMTDRPKILLTKSSSDRPNLTNSKYLSSSANSYENAIYECDANDSDEYFPLTSVTKELRLELESLDHTVFGGSLNETLLEHSAAESDPKVLTEEENYDCPGNKETPEENYDCLGNKEKFSRAIVEETQLDKRKSKSDDVFVWENPLHQISPVIVNEIACSYTTTPDEQTEIEYDSEIYATVSDTSESKTITVSSDISVDKMNVNGDVQESPFLEDSELGQSSGSLNDNTGVITQCEEVTEAIKTISILPPPNEFGGGNPFLMFLCLTVLLQHRDTIMSKSMDYNEMAMHFDKMVRKHNVTKVLNQARQLYARYLKQHTLAQQRNGTKHEDC